MIPNVLTIADTERRQEHARLVCPYDCAAVCEATGTLSIVAPCRDDRSKADRPADRRLGDGLLNGEEGLVSLVAPAA